MAASLPRAVADLPVTACLDEVRAALAGDGRVVLQAAPGAGKTTVVPLALLDEPWLGDRRVVVLEPRRLATRAAARRMAALLGEAVGETVGYRTRDDRRVGPGTRIEVVTEGILTRRLQGDPGLEGVGAVVFDEFHERSLQADLGLALALDARRHLRPDLRLLVMSATLDGDRVAALLGRSAPADPATGPALPRTDDTRTDDTLGPTGTGHSDRSSRPAGSPGPDDTAGPADVTAPATTGSPAGPTAGSGRAESPGGSRRAASPGGSGRAGSPGLPAPIVTSESRSHPVDVRYRPRRPRDRLEPAVVAAVRKVLRDEPEGDVLVFLPGAAEIERVAEALADGPAGDGPVDVHRLYGALPAGAQDAALAPGLPGRRKVVLATDIAETSLTVEGVRVVVDAGLARRPALDATTGLARLETAPTSRASADQRAGRAGRLGPGVAVRLWSRAEQAARRPFSEPEIRRADLAGLALELAAWGTDPGDLPFLDAPPARSLGEAYDLLRDLGAVTGTTDDDGTGHAGKGLPGTRDTPVPVRTAAAAGGPAIGDGVRVTDRGRAMVELPLHPRLARMVLAGRDRGSGWLACLLAALLEDRDVLRGRPDERPAGVEVRLALLADRDRRHPLADGRALGRARERARDLARRAGVASGPAGWSGTSGSAGRSGTSGAGTSGAAAGESKRSAGRDHDEAGALLAVAYPDRIAQARGGRGRFVLRGGTEAWVATDDSLAGEAFLAVAEVDGRRRGGRIRLAAPLAADRLDEVAGDQVVEHTRLVWDTDRDDLVDRAERRLGRLRLGTVERRPTPGLATTTALVDRARATDLRVLPWGSAAHSLRARTLFLHARLGDPWPDLSLRALRRGLDDWLAPWLGGATGRGDLDHLDLTAILRGLVPPSVIGDLDRLAPRSLTVPGGRSVELSYGEGEPGDPPVLSVRVQEMFGTTETPAVAGGRVPVVLSLLSPAGRPVQVTSDLAGFWAGSWRDVRKEMAGRYPKHSWPDDPAAASPPTGRRH